jgi:hypothetical protein
MISLARRIRVPVVPTRRRTVAVVLGTLVAVLAVVVGLTAATGWRADRGDPSAAGSSGRSILPAAVPGPDVAQADAQASEGLFATVPAPPDAARDPQLATKAGTLVAQGADVKVESVALDAATTVEVGGVSREVTSVYRVTVSAGPYQMRDMPAILSVDGAPMGVGAESVDLASLVLFTYDDAVATDGATIALSYGLPGQAPTDWSTTLEVVQ